jgi:hypothetical protein
LHTPDLQNVLGREQTRRITLFMHCG